MNSWCVWELTQSKITLKKVGPLAERQFSFFKKKHNCQSVTVVLMETEVCSHGAACSFSIGSSARWAWPLILFTSISRRPLMDVWCSSSSSSIGIPARHKQTEHLAGEEIIFLDLSRMAFPEASASYVYWRRVVILEESEVSIVRVQEQVSCIQPGRDCHQLSCSNSIIYQNIKMSEKSERRWTGSAKRKKADLFHYRRALEHHQLLCFTLYCRCTCLDRHAGSSVLPQWSCSWLWKSYSSSWMSEGHGQSSPVLNVSSMLIWNIRNRAI